MYGQNQYSSLEYAENTSNISPEDIEKYLIDLSKYVPQDISKVKEIKAVYDAQSAEIAGLLYCIDDIKKQFFIDTATWALTLWEEGYGIETNLSYSYEERREVVKAKKRGRGTTTKAMIKNVAEAFSGGEVNIIEDPAKYSFIVQFIGTKGIPRNLQAFKNMLEDIKPAHLGYEFKYTYTIWNVLKDSGLTCNDAKLKTWNDLKVYK